MQRAHSISNGWQETKVRQMTSIARRLAAAVSAFLHPGGIVLHPNPREEEPPAVLQDSEHLVDESWPDFQTTGAIPVPAKWPFRQPSAGGLKRLYWLEVDRHLLEKEQRNPDSAEFGERPEGSEE